MNVPKTAMAPKPATTSTVTRGGFGESVAKQPPCSVARRHLFSLNGRLIMERVSITERPDWREKATEYGFNFHTMYGEPYWCEEAYYKLTLAQVEKLEEVTAELHQMCLQVVEKVIASDELMAKFRIPNTPGALCASRGKPTSRRFTRASIWRGTAWANRSCWKTTPIRQPRCMKRPSSSGSGWKIRSTPASCRKAATSSTACRKS
jgi:hypothetical protein